MGKKSIKKFKVRKMKGTNKKGLQQILLKTFDFKWYASQDSNLRPTDYWCCYQSVGVFAPEVFRIAEFVNTNFEDKKKQIIAQKLETLYKKSREKTPAQRAKLNLPCAFIDNKRCQVYEARPLACQRQTSFNVKDCKKAKLKGGSLMVV